MNGSVECFRHCEQLIDLTIGYLKVTENFFKGVQTFLPQLKSLRIFTYKQFSDSFIYSFHSMKRIEKVILSYKYIFKNPTKSWCFGKCLSEILLSPFGKDIILINDECGVINGGHYFYENPYCD